MSTTIGWGILGCGDVADRKSGPAFQRVPGSRLVSVMRRNGEAARDFARRHGAARWGTSASDLIDDPDVAAVYVATPPSQHLEYSLAVAAAGKACLLEKPAGRSLAEFQRIYEAFRAAGAPLYVSYYRRHLPRFRAVGELLESGDLGRIVAVTYRMNKPVRRKAWALDVGTSGGGHFYGLAGHMLDLFDAWFGPVEYTGAAVTNVIPAHTAEDAVSLSFRTRDGAVGSAVWNFAASHRDDSLVIEGVSGRVRMRGMSTDKPVQVEFSHGDRVRFSQSLRERYYWQVRQSVGLPARRRLRFARVTCPHEPLVAAITSQLQGGRPDVAMAESALRTARVVDQALSPYYGGRSDAFWLRPSSWQSLQAGASRRNQTPVPAGYRLRPEQLDQFETRGYIGPFACEANWQQLSVPVKKGRNRHLSEAHVFDVCTHPSIVQRVAQVMGRSEFSLFKTRFVVKLPRTDTDVAWHQDVGDRNGGFSPDGRAVPTLAVWMGIDAISPDNGGLQVIPGSHRGLVGDYNKQIKSGLVDSGALGQAELDRAVPVLLQPGEFIIYHGWLLHGSGANRSAHRRAGLNMRFAPPGLECEKGFVYIPLHTSEVVIHDRVFRNAVWGGLPWTGESAPSSVREAG
jgi:predicted dehydrogenase